MKIVRTPLGFDLDASTINEQQVPQVLHERLMDLLDQAHEKTCTVDWSTLCVLPEETRIGNMAGEIMPIRSLHLTVDAVEIVEEDE